MSTILLSKAEAFLYAEARALDDRDWDTWLTLLRLSRPPKEMPSTIRRSPASTPSSAIRRSRRAPLSCTTRESIFRPAPFLFALTGVEPHPYNRHRISVR